MATSLLSSLKKLNQDIVMDTDRREHEMLLEHDRDEMPEKQISFINGIERENDTTVIKVNKNTNQKLIVVTQDKTILCLKRNIARVGKKNWIAPLSTLITLLIALVTSDFRSALFISSAEWRAIFIVSSFVVFGWLVATLRQSLYSKGDSEVIYDIVQELGGKGLA